VELGAGGSIAKWVSEGSNVVHLILSTLLNREERSKEVVEANRILGVPDNNVLLYDFPNRRFSDIRQDILQVISDTKVLTPDLVVTHCSFDNHQDHKVVYNETIRAYKNITVIGYEDPWNMLESNMRMTVLLKESHLRTKLEACKAHKSQSHRSYMSDTFITGMAAMRGMATGTKSYAENFEVIRWVIPKQEPEYGSPPTL